MEQKSAGARYRENLHPSDVKNATRQSRWFLEYFQHLLPQCRWINPPTSWHKAEYKPLQLQTAKRCGFKIPITLISNNPSQIREFFHKTSGEIIAKPLLPERIELDDGSIGAVFAETLSAHHINDAEMLRAMPYIYQHKIEIDHEIRVTALGKDLIAAKIIRGQHVKISDSHLNSPEVQKTTLLPQVESCCKNLMKAMNLEFSCIDLAVNKKGEVFFLEINQAGQFLWLDQELSNTNVLNQFCHLFTQNTSIQEKLTKSLPEILSSSEFTQYFRHIIQNTQNHEGLLPKTAEKSLQLL